MNVIPFPIRTSPPPLTCGSAAPVPLDGGAYYPAGSSSALPGRGFSFQARCDALVRDAAEVERGAASLLRRAVSLTQGKGKP